MRVPLLDLTAQFRPIRDEVLAVITRVCDAQQFILGAEVDAFEKVLIPDDGWLRLSFGIREGAWEQCTDGVLFNVIVSDGRKADVLVEQLLDPLHNPNDRRWIPINLDLSPYAGQEVDIIFNTRAGAGKSVATRSAWAPLGQPEIYLAR